MSFNTSFPKKLLHIGVLMIILSQGLFIKPAAVQAAERPIYVAGSQQDYLRLVSLSLHGGYIPLLYSQGGEQSAAILHFADLYQGNPIFFESQDIDRLVLQRWSHVETVVLSQDETQRGLAVLYCLALEFELLWPVVIAIGCGAATVSLLIYTNQQSAARLILAAFVFILPMLVSLGLFDLIWGISNRALLSFSWGFILIAVSYGLVLLVSSRAIQSVWRDRKGL